MGKKIGESLVEGILNVFRNKELKEDTLFANQPVYDQG